MSETPLFINTGGTMDAEQYGDEPPQFSKMLGVSLTPAALKQTEIAHDYIEWKKRDDSKNFNERDYDELAAFIITDFHKKIIISHGTDRLVDLAKYLKRVVGDKTIFVTGAMLPLANGPESDGYANMEFSLSEIGSTPPGVYVAFHGELHDPENIAKNSAKKIFEII